MPDITSTLARWRVPMGFVCGAGVLVLARPTLGSLAIGGVIATIGEVVRVWAAGHLEKGLEVTRSGPYRLTRHPLYVGSALIGAGVAIAAARLGVALLVATYAATTMVAAIRHDEANMRASFGDQYEAYLESRARPVDRTFSLGRALRNHEHRAVAGLVLAAAIFAAKAVFGSR
jgi:protein-S-isoprenylcysteine O-methyltransferase Ste14